MGAVQGITLGEHSYVVGGVITNHFGIPISTGKYCSLTLQLNILGYDHAVISNPKIVSTWPFDAWWGVPSFPDVVGRGPIVIGNDVWIGQQVSLRPGITIGDGAIIGAGSIVMRDVKPYEIVGGNPIRHIRYRYTQEQIEKLLQIKWWDWSESKIKANMSLFGDINKFVKGIFE